MPPNEMLSEQIIRSMRYLFDMMDRNGSGQVRLSDFSSRWYRTMQCRNSNKSAELSGMELLPTNFLHCLQRVTPPSGMFSFDRFCAAVRLAINESNRKHGNSQTPPIMLRTRTSPVILAPAQSRYFSQPEMRSSSDKSPQMKYSQANPVKAREAIAPIPIKQPATQERGQELQAWYSGRPSRRSQFSDDPVNQPFSRSSSQYQPEQDRQFSHSRRISPDTLFPVKALDSRPRTPKFTESHLRPNQWDFKPTGPRIAKIPSPYQHHSSPSASPLSEASTQESSSLRQRNSSQFVTKPEMERASITNNNYLVMDGTKVQLRDPLRPSSLSKRNTTIDEASESVAYKHRKLLGEERDLLRRGAEVSSKLSEWYNDRMATLDTKQRLLSKNVIPMDHGVHEEKLNYLRAHITEVNRRANTLMESSEKGFPSSLNLEFNRYLPQQSEDQVRWLKNQIRLLSTEVREKTNRVHQLEQDKSLLISEVSNLRCRESELSDLKESRREQATLI